MGIPWGELADIFGPTLMQNWFEFPRTAAAEEAYQQARQDTLQQRDIATGLLGLNYDTGQLGGGLYDRVLGGTQALSDELLRQNNDYYNPRTAETRYDLLFNPVQRWLSLQARDALAAGQPIAQGFADRVAQSGALGETLLSGYADRTALGAQQGADILGGYEARYGRGLANLLASGAQERQDINAAFNRLGGSLQGDLAARGLTSTTLAPQLQAGVERQRAGALGGLNERIRRERLRTDAALSGDLLAAQAQQQAFGAGLTGQELAALQGQQGVTNQVSLDALNNLIGTRAFDAQVRQNRIATELGIRQGELANMDANMAQRLAGIAQYGQWPLLADLDLTQRAVDVTVGQNLMSPGFGF